MKGSFHVNYQKQFITLWILSLFFTNINGQCISLNNNIPDTLCLNEQTLLGTNSTENIIWDFYPFDFDSTSTISEDLGNNNSSLLNNIWGVSTVLDSTTLRVFHFAKSQGIFLRTDFPTHSLPDTIPNISNLGAPFGLNYQNTYFGLEFYKKNNAFTVIGNSFSTFRLVNLKFNNGLNLPPDTFSTYSNTNTTTYEIKNTRNIKIVEDNDSIFMFLMNTNYISVLTFGTNINSSPQYLYRIDNLNTIDNSNFATDIDFVKICNKWVAFACLNNKKIIQLQFPNGLTNPPTIQNLNNPNNLINSTPFNIKSVYEEGKIYTFIQNNNNIISQLTFDPNTLTIISAKNYTTALTSGSTIGFDMIKIKSAWLGFSFNRSTQKLIRNTFSNASLKNTSISSQDSVSLLSFPAINSKIRYFSITNVDSNGFIQTQVDSIYLKDTLNIYFDYNSSCSTNPIIFSGYYQSNPVLSPNSWKWEIDSTHNYFTQNITQQLSIDTHIINLQVTASNNCISNTQQTIAISNLKPEFPDFTYTPNNICTNNEVLFTNNSTTIQDSISNIFWQFGTDTTQFINDSVSYLFSDTGLNTITMTAIGKYGCDTSISKLINVKTGATPQFTFNSSCVNDSIHFTDISTSTDSIIERQWIFSPGDTSFTQNPTRAYSTSGNFNTTLLIRTINNCISQKDSFINIKEKPTAGLIFPIACKNDSISIQINSNDSLNYLQWTINNSLIENNKNKLDTFFNETTNFIIKINYTDTFGCSNTSMDSIEVFPELKADFSTTQNCLGDSVIFTDASNSLSVVNWNWKTNGVAFSTQPTAKKVFNTLGAQNVSLEIINAIGCRSSISKNILISPQPIANFGLDKACAEDSSLFYDNSILSFDTLQSSTWQIDTSIYTNDSIKHYFSNNNDVLVKYHITTKNACTDDTLRIVNVHEKPVTNFSFNPKYGEAPLEVQFENKTENTTQFQWNFGTGNDFSTEENPTFTYGENGIYNISLLATNALNCSDKKTREIHIAPSFLDIDLSNLKLNIEEERGTLQVKPQLLIKNIGTRTIENADLLVSLNQNAPYAKLWQGDLVAGSAVNYIFDDYIVAPSLATNQYICVEATNVNDNTETLLNNNKVCALLNGLVQISTPYPNPANDYIYIDIITESAENIAISVFNAVGKKVQNVEALALKKGYNQIEIEAKKLQADKYFIVLKYLEQNYRKTFWVK